MVLTSLYWLPKYRRKFGNVFKYATSSPTIASSEHTINRVRTIFSFPHTIAEGREDSQPVQMHELPFGGNIGELPLSTPAAGSRHPKCLHGNLSVFGNLVEDHQGDNRENHQNGGKRAGFAIRSLADHAASLEGIKQNGRRQLGTYLFLCSGYEQFHVLRRKSLSILCAFSI